MPEQSLDTRFSQWARDHGKAEFWLPSQEMFDGRRAVYLGGMPESAFQIHLIPGRDERIYDEHGAYVSGLDQRQSVFLVAGVAIQGAAVETHLVGKLEDTPDTLLSTASQAMVKIARGYLDYGIKGMALCFARLAETAAKSSDAAVTACEAVLLQAEAS